MRIARGLAKVLCLAAIGWGLAPRASTAAAPEAPDLNARVEAALDARAEVIGRAEKTLARRRAIREKTLALRARIAYRLARGGRLRAAFSPELSQARALARRLMVAAAGELAATEAELSHLAHRRTALAAARAKLTVTSLRDRIPEALLRPVPGDIARPFSRERAGGVWLEAAAGTPIRAVSPGQIAYVGPIRGLGQGIVIAHDRGWVSVVGPVEKPRVVRGQRVKAGGLLGAAAGLSVYFQLRVKTPAGGFAIDPAPFWSKR